MEEQLKNVKPSIPLPQLRKPAYLENGEISYWSPLEKPIYRLHYGINPAFKAYIENAYKARPTKELIEEARAYLSWQYSTPKWLEGVKDRYFIIPYMIREADGGARLIHIGRERNSKNIMPGDFTTALDAPELSISIVGRENGLATNLDIRDKDGKVLPILAVRYPIHRETGFQDYVYTPYTEALKTPEILYAGKTHFEHIHTRGAIDVANIPWLDAEVAKIAPNIIRGLMITESMDPTAYNWLNEQEKQGTMKHQVDRFYTLLSANGDMAFRRTSSMWANGIIQFIEPTWKVLSELYPHPLVEKDFATGAKNHRSSIIMAYAHLQMEHDAYMKVDIVREWVKWSGKPYLPYLLAAWYNSNNYNRTKELAAILKSHPDKKPPEIMRLFIAWFMPASVQNETPMYLEKFEHVMRSHFRYALPLLPKVEEEKKPKNLHKK